MTTSDCARDRPRPQTSREGSSCDGVEVCTHDGGLVILDERLGGLISKRRNPLATIPTHGLRHSTRPWFHAREDLQHLAQSLLCFLRGRPCGALQGLLSKPERLRKGSLRHIELGRECVHVNVAAARHEPCRRLELSRTDRFLDYAALALAGSMPRAGRALVGTRHGLRHCTLVCW